MSAPTAAALTGPEQGAADAARLAALGYRQRLNRTLGLFSNFAVGFTYLSPLVGVYSVFDYGLATGGPAFFWTIPVVVLGQLLVLLTFAEAASQYPIAGGVYQWAKRLVGPRYAWFSGLMYTWALLVTTASIAFPVADYAGPLLGFTATKRTTVLTAVAVILVATLVNLFGTRVLARAAQIGVAVEVLGTIILTLGVELAVPNLGDVVAGKDADPMGTVLTGAFGSHGAKVVLALIVLGFVSCTLAIQAAATRLAYSFARDGVIAGGRVVAKLHPRFHMPLGAIAVTAVIPAAIAFLPSASVARIITFAVVGIYVGFQSVVLASIIARKRGWRPSGSFTLGRYGWAVNIGALVYGFTAIVVLSWKTPPTGGTGFFNTWLVPISVGVVALLGAVYMLILRPKENIAEDDRAAVESPAPAEA